MNKLYYLSALILTLLAMPLVSYAHCAGKHSGNHPHCDANGGNGGGDTNLGDDYTGTDGVTFIKLPDGGSFDYHIIGTQSNDEIYAGSGADLIEGGEGHAQIFARGGDDEIHASTGGGVIEAGTGNDLIVGGEWFDNINGGDGDDIIFAGAGPDKLFGGPGTDWLEGGDGIDRFYFSLGSFDDPSGQYEVDHYDGNLGWDYLYFTNFQGAITNYQEVAESVIVDMTANFYEARVRDQSGTLVTVNGKFFNIQTIGGTYGDDLLLGDDADNQLSGGDGNNIIYGYGGNDFLAAAGFGNNVVYGGSGNDLIFGADGTNILFGEAGDDFLGSGNGDDELYGGEGCDGFIFGSGSGTDTIMDFNDPDDGPACDKIYIKIESRHLSIEFNPVGYDIIIDIKDKREFGTIILKDALLNDVVVDESTFIIGSWNFNHGDVDCSRYLCPPGN